MSFEQGPDDIADEWERVARDARAEVGAPDDLDGPALLARVLEELRIARKLASIMHEQHVVAFVAGGDR